MKSDLERAREVKKKIRKLGLFGGSKTRIGIARVADIHCVVVHVKSEKQLLRLPKTLSGVPIKGVIRPK
ncbi:MAG: hypothetical protein A2836_02460 [Candidatus Taylorbacteria bacterium RIFCSPHIGHO2_01_FULL_45_63]|uniref:Uncharacterized protein n=1 Tax=Candidatus Taylorbacteria bacterium RIFCSPHIGHO2_02_FULL_45_35 TaxID=1802311 RepID=A0A1G2MTP0_9BACT|nr:MAG: hypothetical protein A2836_02460 [Candidatus Taylorbacteria bacterium RIFCSPHIGHO2_01_FULL_45_63]OHA26579.1 MAG: hypothetical protein A3D56_03055 [Candidatus Taylorbacteria bacterium RIFCSPHIGHO2_02_FULL_45_35]OHA33274.1 MAG: hypothetical protein A3A22_01680 [Candidatus Taylorbacteria bacterium RIFCSPLOWO2_01_FULL_45_34b]